MENLRNKKGLIQQYIDLEQEWDTIKRSSTRKLRRSRAKTNMVRAIRALMENSSPRELMSCLQQDQDGKKRDKVVEEIIKERKAGFESGKIKGRRLSFGSNGGGEGDEGVKEKGSSPLPPSSGCCFCSSCRVGVLLSVSSSSSSSSTTTTTSSFLCDECTEREREVVGRREDGEKAAAETEKRRCSGGGHKYRWLVVATFWVAVGLLVGRISGVFSTRKEYRREFLVPT